MKLIRGAVAGKMPGLQGYIRRVGGLNDIPCDVRIRQLQMKIRDSVASGALKGSLL